MTRMRRAFLLFSIVVLLVAALPAPVAAQKMPKTGPREGWRVGDLAYDFTLKDIEGRSVSLKELRGSQVVHLVFWATWCVPCVEEVPHLRDVYARYHDKGLEILGVVVPMNQTRAGVRAFAEKQKMTYPVLWDEGSGVMNRYRVDSIPQNFLIGRDGIIRYAGVILPDRYEELLQQALGQDPPSTAPRTATR